MRKVIRRETGRPVLSRAAIVREAVAMLDSGGIEALSMRKLGGRLNAGATSLYRHVASRDELMRLAVDEVAAEITVPGTDGADWRAAAGQAAWSFRATARRHPWLASVLGEAGLAYLGPSLMSVSERLAALFTNAGFPDPSSAIDALLSYVIGMSSTEATWLRPAARPDAGPGQVRDTKFANGLDIVLDGLAARLRASAGRDP
jgi:AcrR family transcriptional regulator